MCADQCIDLGYEPAGIAVHPPPPERSRVGSFRSFGVWGGGAR